MVLICIARLWPLLAAPLTLTSSAIAATPLGESAAIVTDNVTARLVAERAEVSPGDTVDLALIFDIRAGWHTYWRNPGDSGEPPRLAWQLPDGVTTGPLRWPYPALIRVGPLANYGYSGRVEHLVELQVPEDWPPGTPIDIAADASWLVCETHCIPEQGRFQLRLAASASASDEANAAWSETFSQARGRLPKPGVIDGTLVRSPDALQLGLPVGQLPAKPDQVSFFADEWGLIEHAAPQPWQVDGERLVMRLSAGAAAATTAASGLLVVEANGATQAYRVDASAGGSRATAMSPALAGIDGDDGAPNLGLPLALALALLGGLVLNLMPCVFPVLAIKALGLAQQTGRPLSHRALHGLAYTGGVLAFFSLIAVVLLAMRAGGAAVGWGFQLQSPAFVALMAYLFLVLGLGLAGAATLGTRLMGLGSGLNADRGHAGAFVTGGLAALVAAPCTAPFMGAALGYAATLAWPLALAIMLTLGLGLALPFLLLTLLPALARRLPRPGPWMEHLKQLFAFPMFATAAWLVWVLSVQTGPTGVATVLSGMVLLAFGLWLFERTRHAGPAWRRGGGAAASAALLLAVGLGIGTERLAATDTPALADRSLAAPTDRGPTISVYSPERLAEARGAGRPVFVNMTAAWCITCLVNERVALSSEVIGRLFAEQDILYLKGDWTKRDPQITDYLAGFGRNGVPIYVYYPPGGEPRVLPQLLTESIVLAALRG
jgi:thiol:disulfide interchange protein DsbD